MTLEQLALHAALSLATLAVGSLVRRLRGRRGNVAWIGRSGV